jgi:hypothetical protein
VQCDASIQYKKKIEKNDFFLLLDRKKTGPKEEGGRGMRE